MFFLNLPFTRMVKTRNQKTSALTMNNIVHLSQNVRVERLKNTIQVKSIL